MLGTVVTLGIVGMIAGDCAHNKVNELRSITVGSAVTDLKYDAAGNLKDDTVFHYRYDEEQRLKAVFTSVVDPITGNRVAGDPIARYKYDALGRRVLKRVLNPDGSTQLVTRYYYDGDRVVEERTGAQNLPSRQYIWGNYVDELLINDTVDAFGNVVLVSRLYALQNSTYSIHALVNDLGAVVERYDYTPYGEVTIQNGAGTVLFASAVGNVYLFTGRELDAESGLLHFRARAYSPKLGRFIQRDPAGFADGMNLYEYVGSRATIGLDPTGMDGETERRVVNVREAQQQYQKLMTMWLAVAPPRGRDGHFMYPHPMGDPPALPKVLRELAEPFDGIVYMVPPARCSSCHGNPEVWFGLNTGVWDVEFLKRNPWAVSPDFVHAEEGTTVPWLSNLYIAATGRAPFGTTREFSDDERTLRTAMFAVEISPLTISAAQRVWTPRPLPMRQGVGGPGAGASREALGSNLPPLTPAQNRAIVEYLESLPARPARPYEFGGVPEIKPPGGLPASAPRVGRLHVRPEELVRFRAQVDEFLGQSRTPALPAARGRITGDPGQVANKYRMALQPGNEAIANEIRVARLLRNEGQSVHFVAEAPGVGPRPEFRVNGTSVEVKTIGGLGGNAATMLARGVRQAGPGGQVIVVRRATAAQSLQEYQRFVDSFKPAQPGVTFRVVDESALPSLREIGGL